MMKNLFRTSFVVSMLIASLIFTGCEEEEPPKDNTLPILSVTEMIVGMTGENSTIEIQASDPDGDMLVISWDIIESPASSSPFIELNGTTEATFTTSIAGLYKVEFTADDGNGKMATDMTTLYIGGVLPKSIDVDTEYPDLFENEDYPDYYAPNSVTATAGLTLEPGVVIEFGADIRLWINGDAAYLSAEGSSSKNIILRGMDKVKGSWKVVEIGSNNVNNKLDFVKILHAGSSEISNQKTALFLKSNREAKLSIKNTHISMSGGYGLYIDGNYGNITEFESNDFSDNDAAPIRFGADNMYVLDENSIYENNGIQAIEIAGAGNTNAVFSMPGTVPYPGIPYHMYSSLELRAEVSFADGVMCLFNTDKRIWVTSEGVIIVNSTSQPVTFTGMHDTPGAWFGLEINSGSPLNSIKGAIISYGGNSAGRGANIYMHVGSQLTITDSQISDSQTLGIWLRPGVAALNESNNTYSNNADGDIRDDR